jgi:hypothetical protein
MKFSDKYYLKYLKYKNKYLELKQQGGGRNGVHVYFVTDKAVPSNWPSTGDIKENNSKINDLFRTCYVIKNGTNKLERIGDDGDKSITMDINDAKPDESTDPLNIYTGCKAQLLCVKYIDVIMSESFDYTNPESIKKVLRFIIRKVNPNINTAITLDMTSKIGKKNKLINVRKYTFDEMGASSCYTCRNPMDSMFTVHSRECVTYIKDKNIKYCDDNATYNYK